MTLDDYRNEIEAISAGLQKKLRLSAAPFPKLVARSRKFLPRHVWRRAKSLADAEEFATHPKLCHTLDLAELSKSAALVQAHLKALDIADERKTRRLSLLGTLSFNMMIVVALLIAVLMWRDFL